jgi:hypothetical protein
MRVDPVSLSSNTRTVHLAILSRRIYVGQVYTSPDFLLIVNERSSTPNILLYSCLQSKCRPTQQMIAVAFDESYPLHTLTSGINKHAPLDSLSYNILSRYMARQ